VDIGSLTGKITLEDQMSAVLKKADAALTKFGESATGSAQKMTTLSTQMTSVGKTMTALSVPIMALGGAALAAGYSIEGAYNTIARKTGETGEALGGLKKDFEAVFVTVPNSAQEVATAIADVHQRLGLTGEELQGVTKKFIDFANVNQIDVATATKTVSTLMGALSEDTKLTAAEIGNASGIMDKLTYASQISGASVGKLAEGVVKGGVAFVEMGFGLNESIALFAQFEKVGANTTDVTSSLHRTMANLAKSGVTDLAGAFKGLVTEIRDAPTYADSLRLSIQAFGAQAGPKLAEEIRGGTYSVDELAKTLDGLSGTTENAAKNSESFSE
jgi:phage-related minor tail protein